MIERPATAAGTCKTCDRRYKKGAPIVMLTPVGAVHPACAATYYPPVVDLQSRAWDRVEDSLTPDQDA